jgi:L-aspartate oxidase
MRHYTDFLVVGSGIAGLSFALKVANYGKVFMITKGTAEETNTRYAQGGIAAVMYAPDSFEKHIHDTLICGDGVCDPESVRLVIEESPERIKELIEWGTDFDRLESGLFDLAMEGGHSEKRILHHKDATGKEIERALLEKAQSHPNVTITDHYFALDILTQHHQGVWVNSKTPGIECYGVYALNKRTGKIETILSKVTMMATGGAGHIYESTTNPIIATGDGVAMVYRAKGAVKDMEFVQFHPTALFEPGKYPSFLISEAVRGFGGILKTQDGTAFMEKYDSRGSLAPRDIVARAIDNEMKARGETHVLLDCTHLDRESFRAHFPNIAEYCLKAGYDPAISPLPVVPSAHYFCGGIQVDHQARTSIRNLYAAGECSCTGLHGANRLASNSLLEAIVYSHRAAIHALKDFEGITLPAGLPDWNAEGTVHNEEMVLITQSKKELQGIMSNYVGIVRSNLRLKRAFDRLLILHNETEALYEKSVVTPQLCELRNMIKVGYLVIKHAMRRRESRGLHFNIDYPR